MSSRLKDTQIGVGTNTGTAPLKFPAVESRKISYWSSGDGGDYGVGVAMNEMRQYVDVLASYFTWGYGGYGVGVGTFTETARLTAAGKMTVVDFQMTNSPAAGSVLTSDASGNAIWAVPGSIANNFFDATVGPSGEDYTTVKAAIDAGHIRIFVKGNVTETANTTMTSNIYLYIADGVTWALSTFKINFGGANRVIYVRGNGDITTTGIAFDAEANAGTLVDSIGVDYSNDTTTNGQATFNNIDKLRLRDCLMDIPNAADCGISVDDLEMENVTLDGSGTNCEDVIAVILKSHITNLTLTGTFNASSDIITCTTSNNVFDGLTYNSGGDSNCVLGGHFSNFRELGAGNLNIKLEFTGSTLSQCYLTGSNLTVGVTNILIPSALSLLFNL